MKLPAKFYSEKIGAEFWIKETASDFKPDDGLPCYSKAEIKLIKEFLRFYGIDSLSTEDHKAMYQIKKMFGATIYKFISVKGEEMRIQTEIKTKKKLDKAAELHKELLEKNRPPQLSGIYKMLKEKNKNE